MTKPSQPPLLLSAFILAWILSGSASAQLAVANDDPVVATPAGPTVCEVDIFYTWQPAPQPTVSSSGFNSGGAMATPSNPPPAREPQEILFERQTLRGASEEIVRPLIQTAALETERRARIHCERRHQSQSSCFAQGIQSRSSDLMKLDFESRRIFREKLVEDCAQAFGLCTTTRIGEPGCRADKIAEQTTTPAPTEQSKKK